MSENFFHIPVPVPLKYIIKPITMMRIILTCLFFILFSSTANSQTPRIITTDGEAQVEFPESSSLIQVKKVAFEKAVVNALEKAFGTAVIQGNSTYLKNVQSGQQIQTNTVFNMVANTYVKGEVIEVLDEKYEEVEGIANINGKKKKIREIKCTIRVKARELTDQAPDFEAITLDCNDPRCSKTEFKDSDPLFLRFRSNTSGYLLVFLDDGKISQCLLPYQNMPEKYTDGVPVTREIDYVLFSRDPKFNYFENKAYTEEYQLSAESPLDQNRMFVIFSSTPITNPALLSGLDSDKLTTFEKEKGYKVPRALKSEDFQDWLIQSRLRKQDIRVKVIDITISRQ
jgi:hypothetical protein